jgi:hypothetical protein
MAAGLGFKTFTTGEVLTAADTNGYLMQGVLVFASSAARASAVTSPQEGQYSYLKDTDSTEYYDGAAWIAAPIGDITGVTAGTGISGGGTSGTVTITNSMATAIDAKADLVVGTGADAFSRLAVGTNGQVLTADSTVSPTGLKWAAVASGVTYAGAAVYKAAGQSVTANTWTTLLFDTENYDTNSFHSTATNTGRFTIPTGAGGYYQLSIMLETNPAASGIIRLVLNGSVIGRGLGNGYLAELKQDGYTAIMFGAVTLNLAAADYLEVQFLNPSTVTTVSQTYQINYLGA